MTEKLDEYKLSNGMIVLGEHMPQVGSAAFTFQLPCGASQLPDGKCGAGTVISDWIFRGAGSMDSKELVNALDGLGLHRNSSVSSSHLSVGSALEAGNLFNALKLYADIINKPMLKEEQFELSRQLAVFEVMGLDDDPRTKVMQILREKFYPDPLGRPAMGKLDQLQSMTAAEAADIVKKRFNLSSTTFAVAGKYDFDKVCSQLEELFGSDQPKLDTNSDISSAECGYTHIQHDGAQVHLGLMTETVTAKDPDYYNAMAAVSILSGGMSSRLFTEVREKRGLCYAVGANYNGLKDFAGINCYAGTTPEKAQETLDVITAEFENLYKDISESEVERAKVGLKSTLIMQSESSSARANAIANDYYLLGRVRTIEEVKQKLEEISVETVVNFLKNNRFKDYTVVTIGPEAVKVK